MTTDLTTSQTHWVIVSDEGTSTRPRQHTTYQSARDEALRLSKLKPGINFAVYQMIGTAFTEKPAEPPTKFTAFAPVLLPKTATPQPIFHPHEWDWDRVIWPRQWY